MKITEYKNLTLGKVEATPATAEEVDAELNNLLKRSVSNKKKEAPAEMGDTVNINYEGFLDGVPFEGGKADGHDLELGSHSFIPGFEEGLVGAKDGDDIDVNVTFPEEYHAEHLAGKPVVFKCHVNVVLTKVLPELNDEFAQSFGLASKDELVAELTRQITSKKKQDLDNKYIDTVLNHIISNSEIDCADEALTKKADEMYDYYVQNINQYGMTLEQYFNMTGQSLEDFRKQIAAEALITVKTEVLLSEIAKMENLAVTNEEAIAELDMYKNYYNMPEDAYEDYKNNKLDEVKADMLKRKTAMFLLENNN